MPALKRPEHEAFALAVAQGASNTQAYIAQGFSKKSAPSSACSLAKRPHVAARIRELKNDLNERCFDIALSQKRERILSKQKRHSELRQIIEARKNDATLKKVPGGDTGWVVVDSYQAVTLPDGKKATLPMVKVDIGISRELSQLELEVARELGQLDSDTGTTLTVKVVGASKDDETA